MLRVLPPLLRTVNNLIGCKTGLMWVVKCATSLFILFCRNVAVGREGRLRLVDFAIGLVNSFLNLPDVQVKIFGEFKLHKNCVINSAYQKFLGLVEMNFGLVCDSYSLPKW